MLFKLFRLSYFHVTLQHRMQQNESSDVMYDNLKHLVTEKNPDGKLPNRE